MAMRALLLALLAGLLAAQHRAAKLYPVDEGPRDPSLQAFRQRLLEALARRDKAFLLSVLHPEVVVSFGPDLGPADFERHWKLDQPESSGVWRELSTILAMGGRFYADLEKPEFCAPYVYTHFPRGFDAFEFGAIVGKDVRARAEPKADAAVVATLSFDVVRLVRDAAEIPDWELIVTAAGRRGYVSRRYVRSPIDYRSCFQKQPDGKWLMRSLVAGD